MSYSMYTLRKSMSLIKSVIFFIVSIGTIEAYGAIYEASSPFTVDREMTYSKWIKEKMNADIFSNPESRYYGIKTDCADAAFALRAIYAYENKLSFKFILNNGQIISEKSTKFDHVSDNEITKLKALVEYLSDNIGSEGLASDNTYSIDLKTIKPGDLYISRWKNSKSQLTRHVYIIKDILPTGDLILYSSTVPRAIRPLLPRKGMPLRIFKERPFGFKRFLPGTNVAINQLEDYSNNQYDVVKLGEGHFFKTVKEGLKSSEDSLELNIQRRIENICVALTTRMDIVEMALEAKADLQTACFKKSQYDEYSTPSRDRNIIQDIERLRNAYRVIVTKGIAVDLNETQKSGLDYLIDEDKSDSGPASIKTLCSIPVEVASDKRVIMTIKSFYDRYKANLVSSNPNEERTVRWGLSKSKKACSSL